MTNKPRYICYMCEGAGDCKIKELQKRIKEKEMKEFMPKLWAEKLQNDVRKGSILFQCVTEVFSDDIKNVGDFVKISENEEQFIEIDQRKLFAFKVNNCEIAQDNIHIMEACMENAKKAIEIAQDSFLLAKHIDVPAENTISDIKLTTENIYSHFISLAKLLKVKSNNIPKRPYVIINPDIEAILLQCSQFTSSHQLSDETLREGSIGRIAGMDVLVSTNLTDAGNEINILAGTNEAITFASQVAKIESIRDTQTFSDLVRGLYLYGAKTVNPNALVKMVVNK